MAPDWSHWWPVPRMRYQLQRPRSRSICRRSFLVGRPDEGSRTSTLGAVSRGVGGGLWSTMHPEAMGAPTRLSIARTTSSTRCRSPMRAVTMSPGCTVVDGFAPAPFTSTWPARHNAVDAARVGVARTDHSHLSTRATSTKQASHERAGSSTGRSAQRRRGSGKRPRNAGWDRPERQWVSSSL